MSSNPYQIWLTFDGEKQKIRFPVLPEKLQLTQGSSNEFLNVAGLGEVTIMQDKPEAGVAWKSFFPAAPFPGVQFRDLTPPETLKTTIKTWMGSKKPAHLIVAGTVINLFVTIEKFDCDEEGGAVGDLNYSISFKEFRNVKVRQVQVDAASQTATVSKGDGRTDNTVTPKTYEVAKGDCLFNIAKKVLGSSGKWPEIASLNGIKSPYTIYAGNVLKMPV